MLPSQVNRADRILGMLKNGASMPQSTPMTLQAPEPVSRTIDLLAKGAGAVAQKTGQGLGMIMDSITPKEEDYPAIVLPSGKELPRLDPTGVIGSTGRIGGAFAENAPKAFEGFSDLSTKLLEKLKGRSTVSKQFVSDLTNSPDLKQAEKDVIRKALEDADDTIDVPTFANKVKSELLPLNRSGSEEMAMGSPKYESIALPDELRGPVADYSENIYSSPIATSAGDVHWPGNSSNYFAHTRIEDLPDGQTRRVIEAQSDLFQKGRLENEMPSDYGYSAPEITRALSPEDAKAYQDALKVNRESNVIMSSTRFTEAEKAPVRAARETIDRLEKVAVEKINGTRKTELSKLEPYRNTWHERLIREEIKQAAKDGKAKLQFPTGETAMKIEGLGDDSRWILPENMTDELGIGEPLTKDMLKVGEGISDGETGWIITDVLGDGKFKAVSKNAKEDFDAGNLDMDDYIRSQETFDISGKVDTENPIYKFYEKTVQKYLTNKYGGKVVTDPQGVRWVEIDVKPEYKGLPVEAFGALALPAVPQLSPQGNEGQER